MLTGSKLILMWTNFEAWELNVLVSSWDALKDLKGIIYFAFDDYPEQLKLLASVPHHANGQTTYLNCEMVLRVFSQSDGKYSSTEVLTSTSLCFLSPFSLVHPLH